MMMAEEAPKKYWRTEFKVVVISEDEPVDNMELAAVAFEIQDGDCSGEVTVEGVDELTPVEAAQALIAQGSDPTFFGLNEDGSSAYDDEDEEELEDEVKDAPGTEKDQ
jgi:hypothetical protein